MALALRAGWGAAASSSTSSPFIAALQNGLQTLFQSPASLIELLPPILLAVPKSRVSHSRKRMRAANKHLKEKDNIVTCPGCGRAKASHNFCQHCYSSITRGFKTEAKQAQRLERRASSSSSPSTSSSFFDNDSKPLASERWARERGGAVPLKEGQLLTKWMRARLGFRKGDGPVRLGQEDRVTPSKPRSERWNGSRKDKQQDDDNDGDDHHHHGGGDMPSNLRFA